VTPSVATPRYTNLSDATKQQCALVRSALHSTHVTQQTWLYVCGAVITSVITLGKCSFCSLRYDVWPCGLQCWWVWVVYCEWNLLRITCSFVHICNHM